MSHGVMLVFTNPASPADDAEFNSWYDSIHLAQVIERVAGIVGARRYNVDPDANGRKYLAVYELDRDSALVEQSLGEAFEAGRLDTTPTLQLDPPPLIIYANAR